MLAKLFGRSRSQESRGIKAWKQYEKKGIEAEAQNSLPDAKVYYSTALEEIQQMAEGEGRHARYFAFKISQIRFALDRVKTQLDSNSMSY